MIIYLLKNFVFFRISIIGNHHEGKELNILLNVLVKLKNTRLMIMIEYEESQKHLMKCLKRGKIDLL